jgi:large subunit ribosomal protein L18
MLKHRELFLRRKERARYHLRQSNKGMRPRLCVFRSNQHISVQIVSDAERRTLVSASTLEKDIAQQVKNGGNRDAAIMVGRCIAERALKQGIHQVVFDRSGYVFHGRVQALATAARESGLDF